jgi:small redox-active disulfide protein 2
MEQTMEIKILGPGCHTCQALANRVELAVGQLGIEATVKHVHDYQEYTTYGILFTPGLVVDGKLVSAGRVPTVKQLVAMLAQLQAMVAPMPAIGRAA